MPTSTIASARRRAAVLPFKLTGGQKQALKEIVDDMQRPQPMNRLLQGDVGAGKTIVALLAALVAMENGLQVAFMAPTEILADQHFIEHHAAARASRFRVVAVTGATPGRRRGARRCRSSARAARTWSSARTRSCRTRRVPRARASSSSTSSIGSACCSARTLREKGLHPDVLVMTATPIPRTLALTTYGDLDVSVDPGPAAGPQAGEDGRQARVAARRDLRVHQGTARAGRQAYIVYPLVEESEKIDLKAATEMADHLAQEVFPAYRVALLHGRMKQDAQGPGDAGVRGRRVAGPRLDDRHRSRRRCAERDRHARGARRAVWAVAAPPAPRPRGPRAAPVVLRAAVSGAALRARRARASRRLRRRPTGS